MTDAPKFLCPWCGTDEPDAFRSIQRALVEYRITTEPTESDPSGFEYTGESQVFDEGCQHEYFRCTNCQHFFVELGPVRSREDADFALLLAASGELDDVHLHGPDGWDPGGIRNVTDQFWESVHASERACWTALRAKKVAGEAVTSVRRLTSILGDPRNMIPVRRDYLLDLLEAATKEGL